MQHQRQEFGELPRFTLGIDDDRHCRQLVVAQTVAAGFVALHKALQPSGSEPMPQCHDGEAHQRGAQQRPSDRGQMK